MAAWTIGCVGEDHHHPPIPTPPPCTGKDDDTSPLSTLHSRHQAQQLFDLTFCHAAGTPCSPSQRIIAAGGIDGRIESWNYLTGTPIYSIDPETQDTKDDPLAQHACRALAYHPERNDLFAASADRSLTAYTPDGRIAIRRQGAHSHPINALCIIDEHLLATGDDDGIVKIWDLRAKRPAFRYHDHSDYISRFEWVGEATKRSLLAIGGDGCLTVYDVRRAKATALSANQDDELLSMTTCRGGSKVVVGTGSGTLLLFSWGQWGDCSDRFPGHPTSVDAMVRIGQSTVLTGSSDGLIRAVSILPNRFAGLVGDHDGWPVERLALQPSGVDGDDEEAERRVASCSHDGVIRFWTVPDAFCYGDDVDSDTASSFSSSDSSGDDDDEEEDEDDEPSGDDHARAKRLKSGVSSTRSSTRKREKLGKKGKLSSLSSGSFFDGLQSGDDDDE